jgi:hypothetical protein
MQTLEQVLEYENGAVLTKFTDYYGVAREDAVVLFRETRRWMWLCASRPDDVDMIIQDPLLMLDNMWHTFILFTRDYSEFCKKAFGRYIHHLPVTSTEKKAFESEIERSQEAQKLHRDKLRRFYSYVYDRVGADIFQLWYVDFANRFTPAFIKEAMNRAALPDDEYHAPTLELKGHSKGDIIEEIVAGRFRNRFCRGCGVYCTCRHECEEARLAP